MQSIEKNKTINYQFKFLYAIGIILIVAGHCKNGGISLAYEWFPPYAFHLGLFVFASGYFYKEKEEYRLKSYIWKKVKKLIIPIYIWNLIYAVIIQITRIRGFSIGKDITLYNFFVSPLIDGTQYAYTLGLWFVVPLFLIEIFNVVFRRLIKCKIKDINEYIMATIYLAFGIVGVYIAYKGYNKGLCLVLARFLYLLPFYGAGILYNRKLEKKDKLNSWIYFAILFIIQLILATIYKKIPRFTPGWCNDFTKDISLPFIVGFTGIAFWLRISRIIEPITKNSKVITTIADNTFAIMLHHLFGFMIVKTTFAVLSKFISFFNDFNWIKYKTSIWYIYMPNGVAHWALLYLIAGIAISLLIEYIAKDIINKLKTYINKKLNVYKGVKI